eukprot:3934386-Rhodomonas_salina.2
MLSDTTDKLHTTELTLTETENLMQRYLHYTQRLEQENKRTEQYIADLDKYAKHCTDKHETERQELYTLIKQQKNHIHAILKELHMTHGYQKSNMAWT